MVIKVGQIWTVIPSKAEELVNEKWRNILIIKIINDPKEIESYYDRHYVSNNSPTAAMVKNRAYNVTTNRVYLRDYKSDYTDTNRLEDLTDSFTLNVFETFKRMKKLNKEKK